MKGAFVVPVRGFDESWNQMLFKGGICLRQYQEVYILENGFCYDGWYADGSIYKRGVGICKNPINYKPNSGKITILSQNLQFITDRMIVIRKSSDIFVWFDGIALSAECINRKPIIYIVRDINFNNLLDVFEADGNYIKKKYSSMSLSEVRRMLI